MTDKQILELSENFGFNSSMEWRIKGGVSSNQRQWECWEEQLLKFARHMFASGYCDRVAEERIFTDSPWND